MSPTFRRPFLVLAACAAALVSVEAYASPPMIEARLRDREVEVGQPTQLTLTLDGAPDATPTMPRIAGVDVEPMGTSRRVGITNGAMTETVSHHYRVTARRAGRFELGPFRAAGARASAVSLTARPAGARAGSPTVSRTSASSSRRAQGEGAQGRAMLRVRMPKRELVVGESVPVTIRAYVKAGTAGTITGAPELGSDAFAIHDLVDESQQGQTVIDGTPYATLTWRGRMTALLPGDHALWASLPATLRWRERARRPAPSDPLQDRLDSLFDRFADDPFFAGSPLAQRHARMEDLFASSMSAERSADVVLRHRLGRVRVTEPPPDGRPHGYGGAVGRFTMRGQLSPERVRAGEPFTVRLTIEGEGTFERVTHTMLSDAQGRVRAYPATSRFDDRGADGRRGVKVIEQSVVPIAPGRLELAPLRFSYFDPARGEYVTLSTEPLAVDVDPSEDGAAPVVDLSDAAAAASAQPLQLSPGRFVERLWPVPSSPWWLLAIAVTMALAVGGSIALARRDPRAAAARHERRRALRAVASAKRRMRSRARRRSASTFYESARAYAQAHLGAAWEIEPAAVTLAETRARMAEIPDALVEVFERADAIQFAGHEPAADDLGAWSVCLERALEREVPLREVGWARRRTLDAQGRVQS